MLYERESGDFAIVDCIRCGAELISHNFAQTKILCLYCIRRAQRTRWQKIRDGVCEPCLFLIDYMEKRARRPMFFLELDMRYQWLRLTRKV